MSISVQKKQQKQERSYQNLTTLLANTFVLYVKTLNFHWNVTGPRFYSLHLLFEKQYNELAESLDVIAEQIRTLDQPAIASLEAFNRQRTLSDSNGTVGEEQMIEELYNDHEAIKNYLRIWIEEAQADGLEGVADLLIQRLRAHEKIAWMLKSNL